MEKRRTLLDQMGQELADKMSLAQCAEAKEIWDAIALEGMTEAITARYQLFCSKTYGMAGPVTVTVAKHTPRGSITFQIVKKAPQTTEFILFMLPRQRREDVFNDLNDWYPSWCEKFGTRQAKFLCWWKVTCCVGAAVMEVMGRVGEFIGRVAPK